METKPDVNIGFQFPGEGIGIAFINYLITVRASMSEENRNRADKMLLDWLERQQAFWVALFKPIAKLIEAGSVEK